MKLSLRFLYLLPVLGLLFSDRAFSQLVIADDDSPLLGQYLLILVGTSGFITALCFRHLSPLMKRWLLFVVAALGALALESYAGWQSWLVYPHVFGKLLVLLHVFALYAFHQRFGRPPMGGLMGLILAGLAINLVFYHSEALSFSAFIDNERGFGAESTMLLLLPALYFLNQYMARGGPLRLMGFFIVTALIVFLQHRSVWISTGVALVLNTGLLALGRVAGAQLSSGRLLPMVLIPLLVVVSGGAVVLSDPQVTKRLETSIEDIMHPTERGTGNWRVRQVESYQPFMKAHPIAGMRLKGFELPVQFYRLADDGGSQVPVWPNMTGHHFHSLYADRIFYFGILGVLLTVLVPLLLLGWRLLTAAPLAPTSVTLVLFSLCGLVFGISYDWTPYFFGVMGLALSEAALPSRAVAQPAPAPAPKAPAIPERFAMPSLKLHPAPSHGNSAPAARR